MIGETLVIEINPEKEIKDIEKFAVNAKRTVKTEGGGEQTTIYIPEEETKEFILAKTELTKTIKNAINEDYDRFIIPRTIESVIGGEIPLFNYFPTHLAYFGGALIDYFKDLLNTANRIKSQMKSNGFPSEIDHDDDSMKKIKYMDELMSSPDCNIQSAAFWLFNNEDMLKEKIGLLNSLIYIYYRFIDEGYVRYNVPFDEFSKFLLLFRYRLKIANMVIDSREESTILTLTKDCNLRHKYKEVYKNLNGDTDVQTRNAIVHNTRIVI